MRRNDPKLSKSLATYCNMMAKGSGAKEALAKTGLDHVKADQAWYADDRNVRAYIAPIKGWATMSETTQNATIIRLRAEGVSWGRISVATGYHPDPKREAAGSLTENEVSKRFSLTAGIAREGTRIGKGGAFLNKDQMLYVGNHKGVGVEDAKPRSVDVKELAKTADTYTSVLPSKVKKVAAKRVAKATKKAAAPKAPEEATA